MDTRKKGHVHLLRLDRGEPVVASLCAYVGRAKILGGSIVGLGAVDHSEIGYFDPVRRAYDRTLVPETRELLSLTGTISRLDGQPFVHAHVTLGAPDHSVLGGHLFEARVAVTGEFVIHEAAVPSSRVLDQDTGLKLLRFRDEGRPRPRTPRKPARGGR
jgi:hypothetical protein